MFNRVEQKNICTTKLTTESSVSRVPLSIMSLREILYAVNCSFGPVTWISLITWISPGTPGLARSVIIRVNVWTESSDHCTSFAYVGCHDTQHNDVLSDICARISLCIITTAHHGMKVPYTPCTHSVHTHIQHNSVPCIHK